jgi:hypothetical protein
VIEDSAMIKPSTDEEMVNEGNRETEREREREKGN